MCPVFCRRPSTRHLAPPAHARSCDRAALGRATTDFVILLALFIVGVVFLSLD